MSSQVLRDGDVVINDVLHSLNLEDSLFVQTISRGDDNKYYLSSHFFGKCIGKGVFLAFDAPKKHFFLAKPLDVLSEVPLSVVFSDSKGPSEETDIIATPPPTPPPRLRFEDLDFGTPPEPEPEDMLFDDAFLDEERYADIDESYFR